MTQPISVPGVNLEILRSEISKEYAQVATNPGQGFHFHTGYTLAKILGYSDELVEPVPRSAVESFAGTGNPFSLGEIKPGERVVDIGAGAGFDSLIAARLVNPTGQVIGVDMTPQMLNKAQQAAIEAGLNNMVEFRQGYAEALPVEDEWADVVISNGVINLCPDKLSVFREMYRVLKPGGRLQIGDILVQKAVPESAKSQIDLWTG
ncbi:MAG TPA: methyltransferase domain-containing protein [Chloroflexia bacterium]|nr:methyltransferase domain-containing protein [Chloroflexia bacterium]